MFCLLIFEARNIVPEQNFGMAAETNMSSKFCSKTNLLEKGGIQHLSFHSI